MSRASADIRDVVEKSKTLPKGKEISPQFLADHESKEPESNTNTNQETEQILQENRALKRNISTLTNTNQTQRAEIIKLKKELENKNQSIFELLLVKEKVVSKLSPSFLKANKAEVLKRELESNEVYTRKIIEELDTLKNVINNERLETQLLQKELHCVKTDCSKREKLLVDMKKRFTSALSIQEQNASQTTDTIAQLRKEKESFEKQLGLNQQEIDNLRIKLDTQENMRQHSEQQYTNMQQENKNLRDKNKELQSKILEVSQESAELEKQKKESSRLNFSLQSDKKKMQLDLDETSSELERARTTLSVANKKVEQLEIEIESLNKSLKQQVENYNAKVSECEKLSSLVCSHESKIKELDQQVGDLSKTNDKTKSISRQLEKVREKYELISEQDKQTIETLESRLSLSLKQIRDSGETIAQLNHENDKKNKELAEQEESFRQSNNKLSKKLQAALKSNEVLLKSNEAYQKEITEMKTGYASTEERLRKCHAEEQEYLIKKNEASESEILALQKTIETTRQRVIELEGALEKNKHELQEEYDKVEIKRQELSKAEAEIRSVVFKVSTAQEAMEGELTCMTCLELFDDPVIVPNTSNGKSLLSRCCNKCIASEDISNAIPDTTTDTLCGKFLYLRQALQTLREFADNKIT